MTAHLVHGHAHRAAVPGVDGLRSSVIAEVLRVTAPVSKQSTDVPCSQFSVTGHANADGDPPGQSHNSGRTVGSV